MPMTDGPDLSFFTDAMNWFSIGTEGAITAVILTIILSFLITRNTKEVRIIQFPIMLGINSLGLYPGMGSLILSGIIFLHASLSTDVLASFLTTVGEAGTTGFRGLKERLYGDAERRKAAEREGMAKHYAKRAEESTGLYNYLRSLPETEVTEKPIVRERK